MASSLNKVILIGNLGKDPEIRNTNDGKEIASFSLATSESWKDPGSGEKKERTEWHRIVVYNEGLVKVIKNYVRKGSKVYLEGGLQTRKWTDNSGQEKFTTEVVLKNFNSQFLMLDNKVNGENFSESSLQSKDTNTHFDHSELDDELPF